jgi:regulator of cell morphogenesis and NO signaling
VKYHPTIINEADNVLTIVSNDYRTADIFKKYDINLSPTDLTLQQACKQKGLNVDEVKNSLSNAIQNINISTSIHFEEWKIDFLIDYIRNIYHQYAKQRLPIIKSELEDLAITETSTFLKVEATKVIFTELYNLLITHINNQETSVFPYIKQIYSAWSKKESYGALLVKTLRKPIEKVITNEHVKLANLVNEVRKTTNDYRLADETNISLNIIMQQLEELDNNLVQHIHLEKNILFPKAILIEKELTSVNPAV